MGKLITKRILLGVLLATGVFLVGGVSLVRSQFKDTPLEILETAEIAVEVNTYNEYSQIQTRWGDKSLWLTQESKNHLQPHRSGRWVVWVTGENDGGKIDLYDLFTGSYKRLTEEGNHQKPRVNAVGQVVWETWSDDVWKVNYYDGDSFDTISTQMIGINPDISDEAVLYLSREPGGEWSAHRYDLRTGMTEVLVSGVQAKQVHFDDAGVITYAKADTSNSLPILEKISDLLEQSKDVILGNPDTTENVPVGVFVHEGEAISPLQEKEEAGSDQTDSVDGTEESPSTSLEIEPAQEATPEVSLPESETVEQDLTGEPLD